MKPNKWQRKYIKQQNDKMPRRLQEIPRELWPENSPAGILRVLRSRFFLVQVYQAAEPALVRLTVNKTTYDGKTYVDGISWEELQAIKRDCGYAENDAVEIFPNDRDVINVANMRHLWVMSEPVSFAWRNR